MGHMSPAERCPIEERSSPTDFKTIVLTLGKHRLSAFVTATAAAGYIIAGGGSLAALGIVTLGTQLQAMSANTANQALEAPFDAMMKRTRGRPVPSGRVSEGTALAISLTELAVGTAALAVVSPAAATMGLANWMLYVGVYTPLKRASPTNTWVGTIVGAIPPLMGGHAAAGSLTVAASAPAVMIGAAMFGWQVVHFMALSFHCREDYAQAGYQMHAFTYPWRARAYAVASCVALAGVTVGGPLAAGWVLQEMVWFLPAMIGANAVLLVKAVRFYNDPIHACRGCFVASYVYLAAVLVLVVVGHAQPLRQCRRLKEWIAPSMAAGVKEA